MPKKKPLSLWNLCWQVSENVIQQFCCQIGLLRSFAVLCYQHVRYLALYLVFSLGLSACRTKMLDWFRFDSESQLAGSRTFVCLRRPHLPSIKTRCAAEAKQTEIQSANVLSIFMSGPLFRSSMSACHLLDLHCIFFFHFLNKAEMVLPASSAHCTQPRMANRDLCARIAASACFRYHSATICFFVFSALGAERRRGAR